MFDNKLCLYSKEPDDFCEMDERIGVVAKIEIELSDSENYVGSILFTADCYQCTKKAEKTAEKVFEFLKGTK